MQSTRQCALTLVVCCVFLSALFGLVCASGADVDLRAAVCPADERSSSPDEVSCTLPLSGAPWHLFGPAAAVGIADQGLLAAVPGGLCLLI